VKHIILAAGEGTSSFERSEQTFRSKTNQSLFNDLGWTPARSIEIDIPSSPFHKSAVDFLE